MEVEYHWDMDEEVKDPEVFVLVMADNAITLEQLIIKDPEVIEETYRGENLTIAAVKFCTKRCLDVLLNYGYDSEPHAKERALIKAIQINSTEAVRKIINNLDLVRVETVEGFSILETVFEEDNLEILQLLCAKFPELTINMAMHGAYQIRTLALAMELRASSCIEYLLSAQPATFTVMGETKTKKVFGIRDNNCIFRTAILNLDSKAVITMLGLPRSNKFLTERLNCGKVFLHIAAEVSTTEPTESRNKASIMKALLAAYNNPNLKDADGNTALHLAADVPTAATLIKAGLDLYERNRRGKLPGENSYYREVQDWFEARRKYKMIPLKKVKFCTRKRLVPKRK